MNRFHHWYCRSAHWRQTLRERIPWVLDGLDLGGHILEVGPGPGLTTDLLAAQVSALTAIEIDPHLAARLRGRFEGTNVTIENADATAMPFPAETFTGAVAFTMLHHVPSAQFQDRLLREVRRVLRPGAVFAGSDSRPSLLFRLAHVADTITLVGPETFPARLEAAGFTNAEVHTTKGAFRFRATVPVGRDTLAL